MIYDLVVSLKLFLPILQAFTYLFLYFSYVFLCFVLALSSLLTCVSFAPFIVITPVFQNLSFNGFHHCRESREHLDGEKAPFKAWIKGGNHTRICH